jgi:HD-GYP domain-containing protein (c-di-GMP phosphodiesterase class II)
LGGPRNHDDLAFGALDPGVERLLEESRPRESAPLARSERVSEAIVGGSFLVAALAFGLLAHGPGSVDWGLAVAMTAAYAALSRVEFDVGAGYAVPTQLVFVPMLFALPARWVALFVAAGWILGKLPDYVTGRAHPDRALLGLGFGWHALGPAAVFLAAGVQQPEWGQWPVYLAALGSQLGCDFVASSAREWLALGVPPRVQARLLAWVYAVDVLLTPVGFLAALAMEGARFAFLAVVPLAGLLALFAVERRLRLQQALALSHAYRGTAMLLGDLVEEDDAYTGQHSHGVVAMALEVGDALGIGARERRDLEFAALLHDVGKVTIPKEVINKAGRLTQEEMALVRTHTIEGHRILSRFGGLLGEIGRIVRSCHERWDGQGYPDGLHGDEIPVSARIIFACDAFDAMTTDRAYRPAMRVDEALDELRANAGSQFDPEVVEVLCRLVEARTSGGLLAGDQAVA